MKRVLWIIIIVTTLISLGIFAQRWAVEFPNRRVEIVYDLPGLFELSAEQNLDLDHILGDLKSHGVETIAIQPTSVGEMMLAGEKLPDHVLGKLPERLTDLGKFLTLPVAFEAEHFDLLREAGFKVAPKINTAPWDVEPLWLEYGEDPDLFIISGQGIMDFGPIADTDATFALVEFATPQISPADPSKIVRLHGISAPEMRVLSDERILNRYLRAVKERNLRVLYVRPFVEGDDAWARSLDLLNDLEVRLGQAGFQVGKASPFALWSPSWLWIAMAGAGIWAGASLYGIGLFPQYARFFPWAGLLAYIFSVILLAVNPILAKQGLALVAAIIFPALALQRGITEKGGLTSYFRTSLISMLGAIFVVGTLSGTEFLIKLQEFRGVKLMHVIPIALVTFCLVRPLKPWLNKNIPIRHLLWLGVLGVVGVFYILRTGNFGLPVLGLEVQAREFLENLLWVRPRTKELFLGHPALFFAVHSRQPSKSWWLPVAAIGQISLVNTFTHIHTFLPISLLRTLYGLVFGYLLGWILTKAFNWGKRWLESDHGFRILRIR